MKNSILKSILCGAALLALAGPANAVPYYFTRVTNTNLEDVGSQLSVDVLPGANGTVNFVFRNDVGIASSITDIYFDDGTLLDIGAITNGSGVSFSPGASPGQLPSANTIDFNTISKFSLDSDSPAPANGVNASSETLTVAYSLLSGVSYADTIAALNLSLASPGQDVLGGLRIGLHVQAIGAQGGSDSYVNTSTVKPGTQASDVPDGGGTLALLGSAMVAMGLCTSKFRGAKNS